MQVRIRGVVLRTVRCGDSELIADLFTESHGRMSFVASVGRGRRAAPKGFAFWRPLNMVEFETELRPSRRLARARDVRVYHNYADLPYHPLKAMIGQFAAEFLCCALRGEAADAALYRYVEYSLRWLDAARAAFGNFHLVLMMRLTKFVGIYPNLERDELSAAVLGGRRGRAGSGSRPASADRLYFDLQAGTFRADCPLHTHYLPPEEARLMPLMFRMDYANMHLFRLSRASRRRIVEVLNAYYSLHLPSFPELRSLGVLREVLD